MAGVLYEAGGLSSAPTASADVAYCGLWNGSGHAIHVREFSYQNTAATAGKLALKRTTARGTNSSTLVGNAVDPGAEAIASLTSLDLAYSVQPTVAGGYFRRNHYAAVIGTGVVWNWWAHPRGFTIANGAGIAIVVPTAVAGIAGEVYFVWEE